MCVGSDGREKGKGCNCGFIQITCTLIDFKLSANLFSSRDVRDTKELSEIPLGVQESGSTVRSEVSAISLALKYRSQPVCLKSTEIYTIQ